MVARALLIRPRLIIADEPVSMVDASLRATILESLRQLHRDFGISLLYITHDLTTAYQISQNIIVLYRGAVAEAGDVDAVVKQPRHPYTQLLIQSIPQPDPSHRWRDGELPVASTTATTATRPLPLRRSLSLRDGRLPHAQSSALPHRRTSRGQLFPLSGFACAPGSTVGSGDDATDPLGHLEPPVLAANATLGVWKESFDGPRVAAESIERSPDFHSAIGRPFGRWGVATASA